MKLHLVRHGATESSGQTYADRRDVALTEAGWAEAQAIAEALAERPIGTILSSPLSRAVNTAKPLAERLGLTVLQEPNLTEFDFGAYEGREKRELGLKRREAHIFDPVPEGEALIDVWHRAGAVIDRALQHEAADPDRDVVCAGHFWINRLIYGTCRRRSFDAACRDRSYRPQTRAVETVTLVPELIQNASDIGVGNGLD